MEAIEVVSSRFSPLAIDGAIRNVCRALERNNRETPRWESLSEDFLWREIVSCILGSRVHFSLALSAIERMASSDLFSRKSRTSANQRYERDIVNALWGTAGKPGIPELKNRYPFPILRARQIRNAAEKFYSNGNSIRSMLQEASNPRDVRRYLASEVSGLGPKQASLFLRNIGYASYIAVLDVHVLAYMNWAGLTKIPMKTVPTLKRYEELENTFIEHSCSFGFPPDNFDIAVWVVVRVAKKEDEGWRW